MIPGASELEARVLVLAPTPKDASITSTVLAGIGVRCTICSSAVDLARELGRGAGAALIAEEAIAGDDQQYLKAILERQLPWSDLPLIVLTRPGADSPAVLETIEGLGNVSLLERPVRIAALVSVVRAALRARTRQYQIREHLLDRERAAEAMREADRRKDEFLAVLAHELRNPLAPIRNALGIMKLAGPDAETSREMVAMLERQVDHMVRLVDDLFEASRITRGQIDLRREPVDLAAVLRYAVETARPLLEGSRQTLQVEIPDESLGVDGDPVRLAQVFGNLLNNASKYSAEGSPIWLHARRIGGAIEVSVRDRGRGIPPEMLSRVFEMFTQVDRRAGGPQTGLGIGLTLVKNLVELHGGEVEARSAGPGLGSEFHVRLRLLPEPPPRSAREAPSRREATAASRVLVVDDNRDSADSIALLLSLLGADARVAYDGVEALEVIGTHRPHAVLLDIGLPGMDGYEVARCIRERADLRDVTLIALTGWGQPDDRLRSREAGFDRHLVKPIDTPTLEAILSSLAEGALRAETECP
ncbi:MAG TPA: ATP-binding protein [Candidatus Polarisedimenticolaceae bacterium]|nr:ATP-binding protein [Candidatus Polarisedimenticolaceae bacterium]